MFRSGRRPGPGIYPYEKGDTVPYFYVLDHGYIDLRVLLDSVPMPDSGNIIMDHDCFLEALCQGKVIWELKLERQVYYCCPAVGDDGTSHCRKKQRARKGPLLTAPVIDSI
jgi:hypothetical protein